MAQKLAVCEFCDFSIEATAWKCINCDITLCENCKTRKHSKIKGSEDHNVFMLNQLGTLEVQNSVRKLELANIICSMHKEEKCTAYCKSCGKELCTFCAIEGNHIGHQIVKLEDVYNEQLYHLTSLKSKMKADLPYFVENFKKMELSCQEEADNYNKAKQEIIKREKEIIGLANREAHILSQELDMLSKPRTDTLNKAKTKSQKNVEHLKQTSNRIDQILLSNDAKSVLDTIFSIDKGLPSKDIEGFNVCLKSSVDFFAPTLPLRFGSLVVVPKLVILQSVQTPLKTIKCLESSDNGTYISIVSPTCKINSQTISTLKYFQLHGLNYVEKCSRRLESEPYGITFIENNIILLLYHDKILSLSESNEIETFFQSPITGLYNSHTCMCVTAEGIIFLRCNSRLFFGSSDVILLNEKGDIKNRFHLKYCVDKIAASAYGTFMIISRSSLIIAIEGPTFDFKWSYQGHRNVNSIIKFEPMDIVASELGLIYVTDANTHSIHVLTSYGDFVANYGDEHGIVNPEFLHINKEGKLIIWCKDGKIHVVDISS